MFSQEARWQYAWYWLSLDYTSGFSRDLLLPISDTQVFQSKLRGAMTSWLGSEEFYSQSGRFNNELNSWYVKEYGFEGFALLRHWVSNVFIQEGTDRLNENKWADMFRKSSPLLSPEFSSASWLEQLLTVFNSALQIDFSDFERRLKLKFKEPATEWDKQMLDIWYGSSPETVSDALSVITRLNLFLKYWEVYGTKLGSSQLDELYRRGLILDAKVETLPLGSLTFPRSLHQGQRS